MIKETPNWVGEKLANRYQVTGLLGAGGMGFVYRAVDSNLDREVVVKVPRRVMLRDGTFTGRFAREIRSLVELPHPHIVRIIDVGEHDEVPFAVLQFLSGGDLRARLRTAQKEQEQGLPPENLSTWLGGVADALDYIHQQDTIHRDVKPDNILFDLHDHVYLSDFGIAKVVEGGTRESRTILTRMGAILGTPHYMAPELIDGQKYDGRVDQYALAVTVYEVVAGRLPFAGAPEASVLALNMTRMPASLHTLMSDIPRSLSDAVDRALAKDCRERFPTCRAFCDAVLEGLPASTTPSIQSEPTKPKPQANTVRCPKCQKPTRVPEEHVGKTMRCGHCPTTFPISAPSTKRSGAARTATPGAPAPRSTVTHHPRKTTGVTKEPLPEVIPTQPAPAPSGSIQFRPTSLMPTLLLLLGGGGVTLVVATVLGVWLLLSWFPSVPTSAPTSAATPAPVAVVQQPSTPPVVVEPIAPPDVNNPNNPGPMNPFSPQPSKPPSTPSPFPGQPGTPPPLGEPGGHPHTPITPGKGPGKTSGKPGRGGGIGGGMGIGGGFPGGDVPGGGVPGSSKPSTRKTDRAPLIAKGLRWLALHQAADGHWSMHQFNKHARTLPLPRGRTMSCNCDVKSTYKFDVAGTAFGVLPFLAAGHTHKTPRQGRNPDYSATVRAGLNYLIRKQDRTGDMGEGMYSQGLATWVLCEAYGMTSDPTLKKAAQRALNYIVRAQHSGGGWRYRPKQAGDTSVTGWQVKALKCAQLAGLSVPRQSLVGCQRFLDSVESTTQKGTFGYTRPGTRPGTTSVGLLSRQYLGTEEKDLAMQKGTKYLQRYPPSDYNQFYYLVHATPVMHNLGGNGWQIWKEGTVKAPTQGLYPVLARSQDKGTSATRSHQKGSWECTRLRGGRIMGTSMALLCLLVEDERLLLFKPVYRRKDVFAPFKP